MELFLITKKELDMENDIKRRMFKERTKNRIDILVEAIYQESDYIQSATEYILINNKRGFKECNQYEKRYNHKRNCFAYIEESEDYKDFKYPQLFVIHRSVPVTIQSVFEFNEDYKDLTLKEVHEKYDSSTFELVVEARDIINNIPDEFKRNV